MRALLTDGWGYPIAVDENESEASHGGVCGVGQDVLFSGGVDRMINNGDDILYRINPGGCL